jgi:SHS2 domain-containing protein
MYEIIDRSTDLLLRITAPDLPQLFAEAARGLTSILVDSLDDILPEREIAFNVAGSPEELDYLLFDWLNELLYLFDTEEILLSKFDVTLTDEGLTATALGERLDPGRHRLNFEINNISYDHLSLDQTAAGYVVEVIVNA